MEQEFQVNGTLIWYYYVCKRQVWLMAHALTPDQEDENVQQGRTIHEYSYPRDKKELNLGNVKIDLVRSERGKFGLSVNQEKLPFLTSATRQLQYYLWQLEKWVYRRKVSYLFPKNASALK